MSLLPEDLLTRIRQRAAGYDERNEFFTADFEELKAAGYLRALVPADRGGSGLSLADMVRQQMRLAGASGATGLAVNMHHVWVSVAKVMADRGDDALDFVFSEAADGEVFGFGISEPGNDLVLFGSRTEARPDGAGGYTFHGTKIFTSLAPAWTRLGTFGRDDVSEDSPKSVYAFVGREGVETKNDWDTLGMRATQSHTTVLDGAHAAADRVVRRLEPGPNPDPLIFGIFSSFEILTSSVYVGIAQRALDLAIEAVRTRTSMQHGGTPLAHLPDARRRIAAAGITLDGAITQLLALARDVDEQVDHGPAWFAKLSAVKLRTTEAAKDVVEHAVRAAGGASFFRSNELSRLYRDALAGIFHPSSEDSAHNTMATNLLGPVPD